MAEFNDRFTIYGTGSGRKIIITPSSDPADATVGGVNGRIDTVEAALTGLTTASRNPLGSGPNIASGQFGSVGSGTADDAPAINAAMAAAPQRGTIIFPPGNYAIKSPIMPPNGKGLKFVFPYSPARYDSRYLPLGAARIICHAEFSGAAMFILPNDCSEMVIDGLVLSGNNVGSGINGIQFPNKVNAQPESGVVLRNNNINGFTGHGITGRCWVTKFFGNTVMRNGGWGYYQAEGATDTWCRENIWAFNKLGGVYYKDTAHHGHVIHTNDRFERSGDVPGSPNSPIATDSPGLRIERGINMQFNGCQTDGNTGDGVVIQGVSVNAEAHIHDITIMGGAFTRDATGARTGTNPANRAGIRIEGFGSSGPSRIGFISILGARVANGNPDDDGFGPAVGPTNAVILNNVNFIEIIGGRYLSNSTPIVRSNDWKTLIQVAHLEQYGFFGNLSSQKTGWGDPSGTSTRTGFATGSVTTAQLAERVKALVEDLKAYGLLSG